MAIPVVLYLAAGLGVAYAATTKGGGSATVRRVRTRAGKGAPRGTVPAPPSEQADAVPGLQWTRFAEGHRAERDVVVGDLSGGPWTVRLFVLSPKIPGGIHFGGKAGKKDYGWNEAPPDGAPVLSATVGAVNTALDALAPVGEVAASAYGVAPGVVTGVVRVVGKVLDLIPGAVARGRVRHWARWREGRKGDPVERARILEAVRRWRDTNGLWASGQARVLARGEWHWTSGYGELASVEPEYHGKQVPLTPGYQWSSPPSATVESVGDGQAGRLTVRLPATERTPGGERRYVIVATEQ